MPLGRSAPGAPYGPDGKSKSGVGFRDGAVLIARIGEQPVIYVGAGTEVVATADGPLQFSIGDGGGAGDNQGSVTVTVEQLPEKPADAAEEGAAAK